MDTEQLIRNSTYGFFLLGFGYATYQHIQDTSRRFRDLYESREDCEADWGATQDCQQRDDSISGRVRWFGPAYGYDERSLLTAGRDRSVAVRDMTDGSMNGRMVSRDDTVRRGGFGSSHARISFGG